MMGIINVLMALGFGLFLCVRGWTSSQEYWPLYIAAGWLLIDVAVTRAMVDWIHEKSNKPQ